MSGQPVKNLSDQNRFYNEFMESLNMRQQLDDMNLQANKEYLKTGTLPAVSQLTDTRTTSEIMADTEKLKASIMSDLSPIANPQFCAAIIQGIQNNFLNADGSLLRFLAQRAGDIVKEIQRVYKFGIVGDTNDVDVLVSFIANLYSDRKNVFGSTKNYINSNSSMGTGRSLSSQDIDKIISELTDIQKRASIGFSKKRGVPTLSVDFERLFTILKTLKEVLPTNIELQSILESFNDVNVNMSGADDLKVVYQILDALPKISQVTTVLNKIELNLKNNNEETVKNLLDVLIGQFSSILDATSEAVLRDFKARYRHGYPYQAGQQQQAPPQPPINNPFNNPPQPQPPQPPQPQPQPPQPLGPIDMTDPDYIRIRTMVRDLNEDDFNWLVNNDNRFQEGRSRNRVLKRRYVMDTLYNLFRQNLYNIGDLQNKFDARGYGDMKQPPFNLVTGAPITYDFNTRNFQGLGITKKRVGRPRGSGIVKQEPIPNFVGFGINEINQKKLKDNIITIRRNTRTSYPDMPAKKVSPYFSNIIKSMIGGSVPNYNDINNLSDEEKDYLYKVVQRSDMTDKLSIPTPTKDRLQKDSDQFEIMKGQILSGNDNKDLVKKFKLLILKLSRNGLLPRGESKDLLETLVELGY